MPNQNHRHIILLIVWDGLRPDMVTAENTPFLYRMARQGVFCTANHAVFPTATRINSASLSTGCYPNRHGIVDNELYIPALDADKPASCADWTNLQKLAELEGGRLLDPPTIGECLAGAGKKMVSIGSGSPGTTYLTDPTLSGPIVNWATAWPDSVRAEVESRLGPFLPPEGVSSIERNDFVFTALLDYLLPDYQPDLIRIWLTEPDHIQHEAGLGAPESLATLKALDDHFATFWDDLDRRYGQNNLTCFLLSDHGFTTIGQTIDPDGDLVSAGLKKSRHSNDIVRTSHCLYLNGQTQNRLGDIVHFLQSQPWIGGVFVRDDLLEQSPGAMPQSLVFGNHRRSAEILFTYRWSEAKNAFGVPGDVAAPSSMAATHGAASPYAVNNTLLAWGKGLKSSLMSDVPCSIIDLAPTILHLLNIRPPREMQGRLLYELLTDGPPPHAMAISTTLETGAVQTEAGPRQQLVQFSTVGGYHYLDWVKMNDEQ